MVVDGEKHTLHSGASVFLSAGKPYNIYNGDESNPFRLLCVSYDITEEYMNSKPWIPPVKLSNFHPEYIIDSHSYPDIHFPVIVEYNENIRSLIEMICNEYRRRDSGYVGICSGLIKAALLTAERGTSSLEDKPKLISEINAESVFRYIDDHFRDPINDSIISEALNFHPYYLARITKKYLGQTPHEYLISRRIRETKELLIKNDLPIGEIADICGFSTQQSFSIAFRKSVGITAVEFRKKHRIQQ